MDEDGTREGDQDATGKAYNVHAKESRSPLLPSATCPAFY